MIQKPLVQILISVNQNLQKNDLNEIPKCKRGVSKWKTKLCNASGGMKKKKRGDRVVFVVTWKSISI